MEREATILNLAWEVIKAVREREVWLWLAEEGWDGAFHATAAWHPEGAQISVQRHNAVVLLGPGVSPN